MPSASSGESWSKRLPSPGPSGSKVSKLAKSTIRPSSGAIADASEADGERRRRRRRAHGTAKPPRLPPCRRPTELDRNPGPERDQQPDSPGSCRCRRAPIASTASGSPRADRGPAERRRHSAPALRARSRRRGRRAPDRLLEGALGEVGGEHVGEADQQRADDPPRRREPLEQRRARRGRRDRDREREAVEAVDEARAERRDRDDHRVRAERVAWSSQALAAAVREPVGGEQVLRHVRVEPGAEDPEAALDDERERGDARGRSARPGPRSAAPSAPVSSRPAGPGRDRGRAPPSATIAAVPCPAAGPSPSRSRERGEADRRREPRPAPPPAGREHGLADDRRRAEDQQEGGVGPQHPRASIFRRSATRTARPGSSR